MATTVYTAIIEKEGDLYAALCPELDVASQGAAPTPAAVTVPIPDHRELAIGTLLSIIRQSGIPRAEFEE